jgi:hypothetical protein
MGMGRGERVQTIIFVFQSYVDTRVVRTLECVCIVMHLYVVEPERGDGSASAVSEGGNVHFPPRVGNGLGLGGMGRTDRQVPFLSVLCPLPAARMPNRWMRWDERRSDKSEESENPKEGNESNHHIIKNRFAHRLNLCCASSDAIHVCPRPPLGHLAFLHNSTKHLLP